LLTLSAAARAGSKDGTDSSGRRERKRFVRVHSQPLAKASAAIRSASNAATSWPMRSRSQTARPNQRKSNALRKKTSKTPGRIRKATVGRNRSLDWRESDSIGYRRSVSKKLGQKSEQAG